MNDYEFTLHGYIKQESDLDQMYSRKDIWNGCIVGKIFKTNA